MNDNQIFEGIPALDDTQGLDALLQQQQMQDFGIAPQNAEPQPQQDPQAQQPAAQPTPAPAQPAQPQAPVYTGDQVAQIINAMRAQNNQQAAAPQPAAPAQTVPGFNGGGYSQQQINAINTLLARGVPIDRIAAYMTGNRNSNNGQANAVQQQILDRMNQMEQYIQQREYNAARDAFVEKMESFGNKFGLSEADLVTFGDKALSMGINLADVNDVEAVFRAVYPEQYAIRAQRIAGSNASQIYGGASVPNTPQAQTSKLEDAYVDAFMRQTMPNQYRAMQPPTK